MSSVPLVMDTLCDGCLMKPAFLCVSTLCAVCLVWRLADLGWASTEFVALTQMPHLACTTAVYQLLMPVNRSARYSSLSHDPAEYQSCSRRLFSASLHHEVLS